MLAASPSAEASSTVRDATFGSVGIAVTSCRLSLFIRQNARCAVETLSDAVCGTKDKSEKTIVPY
jgi:hypothetical protein